MSRLKPQRLLLLSNSRNPGHGFLEHAASWIQAFLGDGVKTVAFVPYAGVTISFDDYTRLVRTRFADLGYDLRSVHETNAKALIHSADAVVVGGGNTFHLLRAMYDQHLMDVIRDKVSGGAPFVGWSAGSNVACPTIRTTNDMPIVQPPTFDALGFVPFQINPHYLDAHPEGHGGETREQRILEFIEVNPHTHVVGLREGSGLTFDGGAMVLLGDRPARVFRRGEVPREIQPGESLSFLTS